MHPRVGGYSRSCPFKLPGYINVGLVVRFLTTFPTTDKKIKTMWDSEGNSAHGWGTKTRMGFSYQQFSKLGITKMQLLRRDKSAVRVKCQQPSFILF